MTKDFLKNIYGYSQIKEELFLIQNWYFNSNNLGDKKILLPKGLLFFGEPGEGKTLIVREYSKSFNYPIFIIEGNNDNVENEVISKYQLARKENNAIIIIDELDRLIDKDNKLIRVLQSQLDGFRSNDNVLTLATANDYCNLPNALLREGRFDRKFRVSPNDKNDFKEIIKGLSSNVGFNFNDDEILELSNDLCGYSISTIRATFNNAFLRYENKCTINNILNTIDFINTGYINKVNNNKIDLQITIHEAGHAIYLYYYCKTKKFQRIYFDEDGGKTIFRNLDEIETDDNLIESIRCSLAGLVAKELILKKHGIGCSNDLKKANEQIFFLLNQNGYKNLDYYCSEITQYNRQEISEYVSKIFDKRVAKFINKNYRIVKKQLKKYIKEIIKTSNYLIEKHCIQNNELVKLIDDYNSGIIR